MAAESAAQPLRRPRPPKQLADSPQEARELWTRTWQDLSLEVELDERDRQILLEACKLRGLRVQLEESIAKRGTEVRGAAGQVRLNPAVGELRQVCVAIARLLGQLGLVDDDDAEPPVRTSASQRSSRAAQARWRRRRDG